MTTRLWYDASDASTVTESGGLITAWNDKSGSALHLSAAGTYQPSYISAGQNGLNIIRFDGVDDVLIRGDATNDNVFQNDGSGLLIAVRKVTSAATRKEIFLVSTNTAGVARATILAGATASKAGLGGRRLDADSVQLLASTNNVSTTAFQIHVGEFDWTNSNAAIYIDGTQDGSTTTFQTDGSTSNTGSNRIAIGAASNSGNNPMPGDIAEAIVVENDITTATRQKLEGYLAHKWGLVSSLPSDHPYKSSAPTL